MRGMVLAVAAVAAALGGAAQAQDRTGYQAIAAGDFAQAERRLVAERRIFPDRPELMLNLAAVYRQTGRTAEANALYAEVLDRPALMMDMPDGSVRSSHAVAGAGLGRATTTIAAR